MVRVDDLQRLGAIAGAAFDLRKAYYYVPVDQLFEIVSSELPPAEAEMSTFILEPTPAITDKDDTGLWVPLKKD